MLCVSFVEGLGWAGLGWVGLAGGAADQDFGEQVGRSPDLDDPPTDWRI